MSDLLNDIINIGALTIIAIFGFLVIYVRIVAAKKRKGNLSPMKQIEMMSGEMTAELMYTGYDAWGLAKLETIKSIDSYIDKKLAIYKTEDLLSDQVLIMRTGSFYGEIIHYKKHYQWHFTEDLIPELIKKDQTIYPFEHIKQKITGEIESLYEYAKEL